VTRWKIAVLGGSTPFVAALSEALAAAPDPPQLDVRFHGRHIPALRAVAAHAEHCLRPVGGAVRWSTAMDRTLDGADVVIHQIRYGDLLGRAADEWLAERIGVVADETLGPAGLAAAMRMAPDLIRTASVLGRHCPGAPVVNITNPLSISTSLLTSCGVHAIGVCELPMGLVRLVCDVLEVAFVDVTWSYSGFNHRSFLHDLYLGSRDLLDELPDVLGEGTVAGISSEVIRRLHAVPVKHFQLRDRTSAARAGRAEFLGDVRAAVLAELQARPWSSPPSLLRRPQPWYAEAVVPLVMALRTHEPSTHVVNLPVADNLVREVRAEVSSTAVTVTASPAPSPEVTRWISTFERQERLLLKAVNDPTPGHLRAALAADPLMSEANLELATTLLAAQVPLVAAGATSFT
jgi:6-phospho-beta-glucosidase